MFNEEGFPPIIETIEDAIYTPYEWQTILKHPKNLIYQASPVDGSDIWQPFPIGMSWQYPIYLSKWKELQIGNHENLVMCSFRTDTDSARRPNGINRKLIAETLERNGIKNTYIHHSDYFKSLPSYKFVISPEGSGIDCHRHYEALIAGCIPVVEFNDLTMQKYKGLPILYTTDYSDITIEGLNYIYPIIMNELHCYSALFKSYHNENDRKLIKDNGRYWINYFRTNNYDEITNDKAYTYFYNRYLCN